MPGNGERFVLHSTPTQEELEYNRHVVTQQLQRVVRTYETRYELRSESVSEALRTGRLPETFEICDWLVAYEALKRIGPERPARLE